jgi:hypothetical protein
MFLLARNLTILNKFLLINGSPDKYKLASWTLGGRLSAICKKSEKDIIPFSLLEDWVGHNGQCRLQIFVVSIITDLIGNNEMSRGEAV